MTNATWSDTFFVGWDVGGWNCDNNPKSRDAIAILDAGLTLQSNPWRGNLRSVISESATSQEFVAALFSLCGASAPSHGARVTLAIDTPLGFSRELMELATRLKPVQELGDSSSENPYLFRQTERFLSDPKSDHKLKPLSAIKDMIGSQSTKGMHVLARFAPVVKRCGVWSDGHGLTAIEAYPTACEHSASFGLLRQRIEHAACHADMEDALACALVAFLFATSPETLIAPEESVPASEGWIWVPRDIPLLRKEQS